MPELPEVETVRRQLQDALPGRTIIDAWIAPDVPQLLRGMTPAAFVDAIRGHSFLGVRRRGKWLIVDLSDDLALVMHLRMTGRIFLRHSEDPEDPYLRARMRLADGAELRWCDVRKFGTWDLVPDPSAVTGSQGPEPLEAGFSAEALVAAAAGRRAPIKSFLLDQRRIAGLGNIYADEALWEAGIHPLRPAGSITAEEARALRGAIVAVLNQSLDSGGSSMRDYLDTAGRAGRFQERWRIYKREGHPCLRCSSEVRKIVVGGRGTRYCPICQPESPT